MAEHLKDSDPSAIAVMTDPEKHGYMECPHCNGYGSSLKEDDDECTKCCNSPFKGLIKKEQNE